MSCKWSDEYLSGGFEDICYLQIYSRFSEVILRPPHTLIVHLQRPHPTKLYTSLKFLLTLLTSCLPDRVPVVMGRLG